TGAAAAAEVLSDPDAIEFCGRSVRHRIMDSKSQFRGGPQHVRVVGDHCNVVRSDPECGRQMQRIE
ncbi:MAG: hypothetical protein L0L18_14755, partial [Acidipropionibacterium jensenii]|nr:hypothetical protein [Acidipropionibacterium jensenii]